MRGEPMKWRSGYRPRLQSLIGIGLLTLGSAYVSGLPGLSWFLIGLLVAGATFLLDSDSKGDPTATKKRTRPGMVFEASALSIRSPRGPDGAEEVETEQDPSPVLVPITDAGTADPALHVPPLQSPSTPEPESEEPSTVGPDTTAAAPSSLTPPSPIRNERTAAESVEVVRPPLRMRPRPAPSHEAALPSAPSLPAPEPTREPERSPVVREVGAVIAEATTYQAGRTPVRQEIRVRMSVRS